MRVRRPLPVRQLAAGLLALTAVAGGGLAARGQEGPARPDDGALALVLDREGAAAVLRPGGPRWEPADEGTRLQKGDLIKAGARGANAVKVALDGGVTLTLGPGAHALLVDAKTVELQAGELHVEGGLTVTGPGGGKHQVSGAQTLRASQAKRTLEPLQEAPRWLTGYEANASTECLGSLLATVDGRNVPLTMGYHKVTVDVRDQLARTVIEESFVNHTGTVLEGVFHFPLPADASISGFGMWIGDELVHGEIVEKERARAIYETILREKRDPGLLEWAGGNVFKARVYPIGAEKRIRISYTQLLPSVRGPDGATTWTYRYALQSELLRQHPLKALDVQVTVASATPLSEVRCPSHAVRVEKAERSARLALHAEEYTPDRDLEVTVKTAPAAPAAGVGITTTSHRRGDDGYLLVRVDAPPAPPAGRTGEPLDLLVLADTSGSVSGAAREAQLAFVAALLEGLGPKDSFDLATCDASVGWAFGQARAATPDAADAALGRLSARRPLGWTNLEAAIAAAAERAGPATHVVYVGDGVPTTGDADAAACARRVAGLYKGKGTFHAVAPGSSYEQGVLAAIAALGPGGSVVTLGGGSDPAGAALALVDDLATPRLTDLRIAFEGFEAAAVCPTALGNVPAGGQAVVVGRWDPRGGEAKGRVVVTGAFGGRPVRAQADVVLSAAEASAEDASFIPRLWARRRLDQLLEEGASKETKERVIALSEDFQIITPYTSFLVLETDADRERFQVKKRLQMRDAEEFFAKGRDAATHELRRKQLLEARAWRRRLRANLLASLADLKRELTWELGGGDGLQAAVGRIAAVPRTTGDRFFAATRGGADLAAAPAPAATESLEVDGAPGGEGEESNGPADADDATANEAPEEPEAPEEAEAGRKDEMKAKAAPAPPMQARRREADKQVMFERSARGGAASGFADLRANRAGRHAPHDGLGHLIAQPGGPRPPAPAGSPAPAPELLPLDRRVPLRSLQGGLRITTAVDAADARGRPRPAPVATWLVGDAAGPWATLSAHLEGQGLRVEWCARVGDRAERGAIDAATLIGGVRAATEHDAQAWPSPFGWHFGDEARTYAGWTAAATSEKEGEKVVRLVVTLTTPADAAAKVVVVIDAERAVPLEVRHEREGKLQHAVAWTGHTQVDGLWWPGAQVTRDAEGKVVQTLRITVERLPGEAFGLAWAQAVRASTPDALLVPLPLPEEAAARQAEKEGKAGLGERWVLLGRAAASQRWELAWPQLEALEALPEARLEAFPRRGAAFLRMVCSQLGRRHEELKAMLLAEARELAARPRRADLTRAQTLLGLAHVLNSGNERLELLQALKPVFARRAAIPDTAWWWDQEEVGALEAMGRRDQARRRLREMVKAYPDRVDVHVRLAWSHVQQADLDAGLEHLERALADHGPWPAHEAAQLGSQLAHLLWQAQRLEQLVALVERWETTPGQGALQDASVLDQYLSALVMLDRVGRARDVVKSWVASIAAPGPVDAVGHARAQAAIRHLTGQGQGMWTGRLDDGDLGLLVELARALIADEAARPYAGWILGHHLFARTKPGQELLRELFARLQAEVETAPPELLQALLGWSSGFAPSQDGGAAAWEAVLERLFARWERSLGQGAPGAQEAARLGALVDQWGGPARALKKVRLLLARAKDDDERLAFRSALLELLLERPWSGEAQTELLGLLPEVGPRAAAKQDERDAAISAWVVRLARLVDWATSARAAATVAALPDVNALPRRRLRAAQDEALRAARAATVELLAGLAKDARLAPLHDWALVDRAWLQVKLRTEREAARAWSLARLRGLLAARAQEGADPAAAPAERDRVLAARCLATLLFLAGQDDEAARAKAEAELRPLLDGAAGRGDALLDWREATWALLMLCERTDALEALLRGWFGDGAQEAQLRWGVALAYLQAERGALDEAVKVVLALEKGDAVGHGELRALADWLTVLDRKDDATDAKVRSWALLDEWAIAQRLQQDLQRVQRRGEGVPEELDPEAPVRIRALLKKSTYPQNHAWLIGALYTTTRDFRVLEGLAEGLLGHSAQAIYPFLQQLRHVTEQLQEEATLDRLSATLEALHARARTDVDRRALRLLEMAVERRAAEQTQGARPHVDKALRALQEAFKGAWADGEPELMAGHLSSLGPLKPAPLGEEQLRQLRALADQAAPGTRARLQLSGHLAQLLWAHGQREPAAAALEAALTARRQAEGGATPWDELAWAETLASFRQQLGAWRSAEALWTAELEARTAGDGSVDQRRDLELRRLRVQQGALAAGAEVSLGAGDALYAALHTRLLEQLRERTNEGHLAQLVNILCSVWDACAQDRRGRRDAVRADWRADLRRFGAEALGPLLARHQHRQAGHVTSMVAHATHRHLGARAALELLVTRAEAEPRWLRLQNQDLFAHQGGWIAQLRREAGPGEVDARLLALVLGELQADLRSGWARNRSFYDVHSGWFWAEKKAEFARVAREVLAERSDVEATVVHVADYLWRGLELFDEALAALRAAHGRGLLGPDSRWHLVGRLHERGAQDRSAGQALFEESLPLIEGLVEERPDQVEYRAAHMRGGHGAGRPQVVRGVFDAAVAHFKAKKLWHEGVIAALAPACVDCGLHEDAVALWREAIELHVKSAPNRGVGDGVLSTYYRSLAQALSGLGRTDEAVDAASGAIVAWGSYAGQRAHELAVLEQVLSQAKDLGDYQGRLEAEVARTKLENPTLRRALGKVWLSKGKPELAEKNLRAAVEAAPNDQEALRLLVQVADQAGARDRAAEAQLALAEASPRDAAAWQQLGDRWAALGEKDQAERAWTNLVEMLPQESEGHEALARVRERQGDWSAAADRWRHVVRVRSQEAPGWLGLANALVQAGRADEARDAIDHLLKTDWEPRFGDVKGQAVQLQQRLQRR